MTQQAIESTTQLFLDIYDITDDVLLLKDGSSSIILTVNAMNFGLLAEPEQDAIMYAYAGLLNSLNYPIQIVIRSQTKDVTSYLNLLKEEEEKMVSDVKRNWISRYRSFVSELIKERNVLDKKFYVVVSASSLEMGLLPPSSVLPGQNKIDLSTIERSVILEKAKEILEPRRDHLLGQLARIGLYGYQLATQEIIQLFYLSYNPEAAEGQQITDTASYTTPLVQASVRGGFMDTLTTAAAPAIASTPAVAPIAAEPVVVEPVVAAAPVEPPIAPAQPLQPTSPLPAAPIMGSVSSSAIPSITVPTNPGTVPAMSAPSPTPATPVMAAPTTPAAPNNVPAISVPPAAPVSPAISGDIAAIQNEINSTLQQIGAAPVAPATLTEPLPLTTNSPAPSSLPTNAATKTADSMPLPELPEI